MRDVSPGSRCTQLTACMEPPCKYAPCRTPNSAVRPSDDTAALRAHRRETPSASIDWADGDSISLPLDPLGLLWCHLMLTSLMVSPASALAPVTPASRWHAECDQGSTGRRSPPHSERLPRRRLLRAISNAAALRRNRPLPASNFVCGE